MLLFVVFFLFSLFHFLGVFFSQGYRVLGLLSDCPWWLRELQQQQQPKSRIISRNYRRIGCRKRTLGKKKSTICGNDALPTFTVVKKEEREKMEKYKRETMGIFFPESRPSRLFCFLFFFLSSPPPPPTGVSPIFCNRFSLLKGGREMPYYLVYGEKEYKC